MHGARWQIMKSSGSVIRIGKDLQTNRIGKLQKCETTRVRRRDAGVKKLAQRRSGLLNYSLGVSCGDSNGGSGSIQSLLVGHGEGWWSYLGWAAAKLKKKVKILC